MKRQVKATIEQTKKWSSLNDQLEMAERKGKGIKTAQRKLDICEKAINKHKSYVLNVMCWDLDLIDENTKDIGLDYENHDKAVKWLSDYIVAMGYERDWVYVFGNGNWS